MRLLLVSFLRAALHCIHPRVILLSLLPLALLIAMGYAAVMLWWQPAVDAVRLWLADLWLFNWAMYGLEKLGWGHLRSAVAPVLLVSTTAPLLIVLVLLTVTALMSSILARWVQVWRFASLQRHEGAAAWWESVGTALGSALVALVLLVVSSPLWLLPPLAVVLPPLIWGWLTYRVMSVDVLVHYTTRSERKALQREHYGYLLAIGVVTGYLGAVPTLAWVIGGIMSAVFAPLLVLVAMWTYTLIFVFSSLWFAHYCLAALHARRQAQGEGGSHNGGASAPSPEISGFLAKNAGATPAAQPLCD